MAFDTRFVLDTNILVHCVRDDAIWAEVRESYQLMMIEPTPIISIVTEGELRSLSMQFHWGPAKVDRMEFSLGFFDLEPVDSRGLVDCYALIDSHLHSLGHAMGKNDLWIAATAIVHDATLLTTDADFDRLHPRFLPVERIAPA